jgi:hypothetical protein
MQFFKLTAVFTLAFAFVSASGSAGTFDARTSECTPVLGSCEETLSVATTNAFLA